MEHLGERVKIKRIAFNKFIKIMVLPFMDFEKET